jgi:hypothetical protein
MIQHDFQVIHYMYICSIFVGIEKLKDREYLGTVHNLCLNSDYAAAGFATFSNISAISWRPVLVKEEARVPRENHRLWASNWLTLSLATASRVHPFL